MTIRFDGKIAIVTGGGNGLGRQHCLQLAARGAKVVVNDLGGSRDGSGASATLADAVAAEIKAAGGAAVAHHGSVATAEGAQSLVRAAVDTFGRLDALINNAARGPTEADPNYFLGKPKFWEADPKAYRTMVETNLIGAFLMARAATPPMVAQGFGRIVNISTSLPTMVMQGLAPYGALKAALETSSVVWARDLEGTGVTVNVLLPGGPADTALIPGGTVGTRAIAGFAAGKGARGDEGRVGGILPAEIMVEPTLWLCADDSSAFTGRRIVAKDWDPDLPPGEAAAGAMQPQHPTPRIM